MMSKNNILLILIFISSYTCAQDNLQNLQKYWYYKERLKNFVYVSPNFNEAGTNIPAERISQDQNMLIWGDGNGAFNQYISVLATEYRLLKNFGQDYSQSIKELYYALKSFERLDETAEAKDRLDGSQQSGDLNGFFRRNDANDDFWDKYKKGGTSGYFNQTLSDYGDTQQNSLDNCIHYLESFALVNALVDNESVDGVIVDFKQLVKDNSRRIIQNMQQQDDPIPVIDFPILDNIHSYSWYLKNPITGEPISLGGGLDGTMLYSSYGFAKSANHILGVEEFNGMEYSKEITKVILSNPITEMHLKFAAYERTTLAPVPFFHYVDVEFTAYSPDWNIKIFDLFKYPETIRVPILPPFYYANVPAYITNFTASKTWDIGDDDYKARSLCATGDIDIVNGLSPYEVLIKKQNESSVYKYEHFPLIWSVITNNFAYIKDIDRQNIRNLLNIAPACGPYKFAPNNVVEYANYEWSSPTRLVWPERLGENSFLGYYNGLDYMLLHNLYWLTNFEYPENVTFNNQPFGFPRSAIARNTVSSSAPVNFGIGSVSFFAGNQIVLSDGFSVKAIEGREFKARIASGMTAGEDPLFFQNISLEDYPQCQSGLKSVGIAGRKSSDLIEQENASLQIQSDSLLIYPNPFNDFLHISNHSSLQITRIGLYDGTGNLVKMIKPISPNSLDFNLSMLPKGIYFLRVYAASNEMRNFKIVKR